MRQVDQPLQSILPLFRPQRSVNRYNSRDSTYNSCRFHGCSLRTPQEFPKFSQLSTVFHLADQLGDRVGRRGFVRRFQGIYTTSGEGGVKVGPWRQQ